MTRTSARLCAWIVAACLLSSSSSLSLPLSDGDGALLEPAPEGSVDGSLTLVGASCIGKWDVSPTSSSGGDDNARGSPVPPGADEQATQPADEIPSASDPVGAIETAKTVINPAVQSIGSEASQAFGTVYSFVPTVWVPDSGANLKDTAGSAVPGAAILGIITVLSFVLQVFTMIPGENDQGHDIHFPWGDPYYVECTAHVSVYQRCDHVFFAGLEWRECVIQRSKYNKKTDTYDPWEDTRHRCEYNTWGIKQHPGPVVTLPEVVLPDEAPNYCELTESMADAIYDDDRRIHSEGTITKERSLPRQAEVHMIDNVRVVNRVHESWNNMLTEKVSEVLQQPAPRSVAPPNPLQPQISWNAKYWKYLDPPTTYWHECPPPPPGQENNMAQMHYHRWWPETNHLEHTHAMHCLFPDEYGFAVAPPLSPGGDNEGDPQLVSPDHSAD